MNRRSFLSSGWLLTALLQAGCLFQFDSSPFDQSSAKHAPLDFSNPVLARRQILVFGELDEPAAERATQQLLFLEGQSHDPIDLYLMTPGGEFKSAMAIEQVMRMIKSPVNTHALAESNSGGALLLAAGTGKRRAFRGAMVIVHGLKVHGKPPRGTFALIQDAYTRFWRQHAHLPESWLPIPPDTLHVLTAEQALQYGLVDELIEK